MRTNVLFSRFVCTNTPTHTITSLPLIGIISQKDILHRIIDHHKAKLNLYVRIYVNHPTPTHMI